MKTTEIGNLKLTATCIIVAMLALTCLFYSCKKAESKNPNIIFFFVDDMGWQDTSVPFYRDTTELNKRYHTPNMEKLAEQGIKFTQAYACPLCTPSRVSLMTGLNAARHRVTNWTLSQDVSPDPENPKVQPPAWNVNGLSPVPGARRTVHAVTLPMLLGKAGYKTIHVGKAHFGATEMPGEDPVNLGFDVNIAGGAMGGPGSYYGINNFSAAFRSTDRRWDVPGLEAYHGKDIYLNEVLTIEAKKELDKAIADGRPFYLYMSQYAIHAPWEKDERFYQKYIDAGLNEFNASYASMLESMDKSLGDLMDYLSMAGIENNTIIVFMSDNGQPSQATRNLPLRGHKITPYEGGIRVPMIVKWPGVAKPGTICDSYTIIEDIFPTFLEMAGVKEYQQIGGKIDGVSFVPLIRQETGYPEERAIFWHFPHTYGYLPYSVVRKGDWKLIYNHAGKKLELYNIREDISEENDLSEVNPEKLREQADILTGHLRESGALMPTDRETGKEFEYPAGIAY